MSSPAPTAPTVAAFFDVDGTLVKTTIVDYYRYFRCKRMGPAVSVLWRVGFLFKCIFYLVLDKISRSRLNIIFYRSYRGLRVDEIMTQVPGCYRDVIAPRQFEQAVACIEEHRAASHRLVLVTGSIDFIIKPLADELDVGDVVAPTLLASNGTFTGALDGPPVGEEEKARRIRHFADAHHVDLSKSHAYGDSIADLPMLEAVGFPHVINPDRALASLATRRGWPIHRWTVASTNEGGRR